MEIIKLKSNDGEIIEVDKEIIKSCEMVVYLLDELDLDDSDHIILPNIDSVTLKKVIEWVTFHKSIDTFAVKEVEDRRISSWTDNFFNVDNETLLKYIVAAQYMGIKKMFQDGCAKAAQHLTKNTREDVREIFQLHDD